MTKVGSKQCRIRHADGDCRVGDVDKAMSRVLFQSQFYCLGRPSSKHNDFPFPYSHTLIGYEPRVAGKWRLHMAKGSKVGNDKN
jgi:hypothetical protein